VAEAGCDGGCACSVSAGHGAAVVVADLAGGLGYFDQAWINAVAAGEPAGQDGQAVGHHDLLIR
jgi:hypothetical protein